MNDLSSGLWFRIYTNSDRIALMLLLSCQKCASMNQIGKKKAPVSPISYKFCIYFQVHMKEVMSAVWLHGLDVTYLREQVGRSLKVIELVSKASLVWLCCPPLPLTRPWGSHWWGRWSETIVSPSWREVRFTERICWPLSNPEVTRSVSSSSEEKIASECLTLLSLCLIAVVHEKALRHYSRRINIDHPLFEPVLPTSQSSNFFLPLGVTSCVVLFFCLSALTLLLLFCLYRTKKATAATRCMCPLYDLDRRGWIELQPMSTARLGHGAVAAGQFGVRRWVGRLCTS